MSFKIIEAGNGETTPLMTRNIEGMKKFQAKNTEGEIKRICEHYGIKNVKTVLDMNRDDFSLKSFREGAYKVSRNLKEAQAELSFGQLLRAGVQNTFNDIYQAVEVVYPALVREAASNKRQEFYAPLERVGFPKKVIAQDTFPETNFKGLDLELINAKYGMLLSIERELIDDDMTGQIVQRAQQMGENARLHEEAAVMARLFNQAISLDGESLPVSATYSTVYSTSGIHTGGYGINATTAARLSQTGLMNGYILAQKMLDQSGRKMVVMPKLLAVSPQDIFSAKALLNSDMNSAKASTAAADDGKNFGTMSINTIKGMVGVVCSRFAPDYGAVLVDAGKGFVFQRRDAQEVTQENPQSGPAFSQEVFRYKLRSRWETDFIDPKFMINLNTSFSST